ncbi:glycosyltransferase [Kineococcus rubinsiae]|uniref:glycosyltransferase n=1 Tax=Kineococcus rubinsiae TaxID=2609562 RepID=UPI001431EB4A|nr:glycosyltransferase family 2 protein [Kineococcus rubinsiae]NIZ93482.1 glycosyltransferase family 2 protein [Kineococcus rubinsiae]
MGNDSRRGAPGRGDPRTPLLTACLIVRDEVGRLDACLSALAPLVDEVVVHDTGSGDGTLELLRARDVVLVEGSWHDDFAAARNVAHGHARGEWVLVVDADEVVSADRERLHRRLLDAAPDQHALAVRVENTGDGSTGYSTWSPRLFRRRHASWVGRVHEHVEIAVPQRDVERVATSVLRLEHSGYAGAAQLTRKGERNLALARTEFEDVTALPSPPPGALALAALNVGRAAIGAGQDQQAVDAFEAVRELAPSGPLWQQATDFLARVLLAAGLTRPARVLADQLAASGAPAQYCRWLLAGALAQEHRPVEALALLSGVEELIDPAGRQYDPAQVTQLRELCRELAAGAASAVPRHARHPESTGPRAAG